MLSCLFIAALWSIAGKGVTSWLLLVMFIVSCYFPMWYPGSGVVLDCIVSWSLTAFLLCSVRRYDGECKEPPGVSLYTDNDLK